MLVFNYTSITIVRYSTFIDTYMAMYIYINMSYSFMILFRRILLCVKNLVRNKCVKHKIINKVCKQI